MGPGGGDDSQAAGLSAPRVTRENYRGTLEVLWAVALMVEESPVEEMIAAAERADSVGAILDPTLYRTKAGALAEDLEMLRALRQVQAKVREVRNRRAGR